MLQRSSQRAAQNAESPGETHRKRSYKVGRATARSEVVQYACFIADIPGVSTSAQCLPRVTS
jgi:hypothetical protein